MIPTLFLRNEFDGMVTDKWNASAEEDCRWVRDAQEDDAHCVSEAGEVIIMSNPPRAHAHLLRFFFDTPDAQAIVFTHADGRQAQITRQDFGL